MNPYNGKSGKPRTPYEKNSPKKKDSPASCIEDSTSRYEDILKAAPELPTGIAVLRGLCKIKKYRHSSQERKGKTLPRR